MKTIFGMRVIINTMCENVPRMQVSAEFARVQSPELVASTNAWMLEFFGVHDVMYAISDPATFERTMVIGPRAHAKLLLERRAT